MPRAARARTLNVVPDSVDFRDREYLPSLTGLGETFDVRHRDYDVWQPRVLDQKQTSGCTGFALAAVVEYLQKSSGREPDAKVSPFMLYYNARRYDGFRGTEDDGSTLRGAMKGWYKHGVCRQSLWKSLGRPRADSDPNKNWYREAARRPLGAYYRIQKDSVTDMHAALAEVGVLFASAECHAGWDAGFDLSPQKSKDWTIPLKPIQPEDGGQFLQPL